MTTFWQCMVTIDPNICVLEELEFAHGLPSLAMWLIYFGIWLMNFFLNLMNFFLNYVFLDNFQKSFLLDTHTAT